MEELVVQYMKTLPSKKARQFSMYFKGWKLADENDTTGLYMVEDSKITEMDRLLLAKFIFSHIRRNNISMEKLISMTENL